MAGAPLDQGIDRSIRTFYVWTVTLAEVKNELERLSAEERRHLAAYLLLRDRLSDPEGRAELARKIDDKDPAHWLSIEEAEKRFND
jgi:hypothetical protein